MFKSRHRRSFSGRLIDQIWPKAGFRRAWSYRMHRLARLDGSEHRISIGFAAGAFASFTPFMGLHFLIAALIAFGIRGSVVASAVGTVVGNPLTFPLIWLSAYKVGSFVLGSGPASEAIPSAISWASLTSSSSDGLWESIAPVLLPMTVGGAVLGLAFATACYAVIFALMRKLRAGGTIRVSTCASLQRSDSSCH